MRWMMLPLTRYAEFSGRSRRQEFWMFFLLQLISYVLLTITAFIVGIGVAGFSTLGQGASADGGVIGAVAGLGMIALLYVAIFLGLFIPNLALAARRLHDTGRSGWWQLLYWAPWILSLFVSLAAAASPSTTAVLLNALFSGLQLIGLLVLIVFYCLEGNRGPNRFGPDPKGASDLGDLNEVFR